ncbi:hypothetical protein PsorP6_011315 [Peronosclerospora sorghi]|uniref:Uncharacterized protein n=1 Tax=Peronosclerospora sorghi TaxID=230839 RepID=A0ACC0WLP3_9STRA|nr:hypothetical protein PsorP6_011315 [Peronosclerospora sorghi]
MEEGKVMEQGTFETLSPPGRSSHLGSFLEASREHCIRTARPASCDRANPNASMACSMSLTVTCTQVKRSKVFQNLFHESDSAHYVR